ncbi:MAG: AraC family transcriptional regulator [Gulosibacter sp.]|uniref:AraC family transcriptional regulator n=1 Tax=Gulosibacter sp. TaxID=2817531 RepID=UPI003F9096FC
MARWDTRTLPEAHQFEYYQQVICQAFVPLRPIPVAGVNGFAATVETRELGPLNRASVSSPEQATLHGRQEVANTQDDYFFVNLQLVGNCFVRQGTNEAVIAPGQFAVLDTMQPFALGFDRDWRMLSFRLPREYFSGALLRSRAPFATATGSSPAGATAIGMIRSLWSLVGSFPDAAGTDLSRAFAAVVSAAFDEASGAPVATELAPPLSRALVLEYLQASLSDPDLSVERVSRVFGISPRRLHALFEDSDQTFAESLRGLRMTAAAEMLLYQDQTVAAVGANVGYPEPTSFSRAFRRVWGHSPAAHREIHA